jgi:hypothetical protein
MKMAVLTSLNFVGLLFRRWPTVVLKVSLCNERVILHEQEGGSAWCHAVATLHFNWTLFKKQNHQKCKNINKTGMFPGINNAILCSLYYCEI